MFNEVWRKMRETDKPIYPATLQDQLEALKIDAQLQDFRAIRERMKADPTRPTYHFTRPDGRINDPNGLCFWQGKWHLFYQAVDRTFKDGQIDWNGGVIHWGHAVSEDLIHWQDLPFAIYPGRERDCYSGACLVEDDRVIAAYYGFTPERKCGIMLAQSSDPLLLNWEKLNGGEPIIRDVHPEDNLPYTAFDAFIWRDGDAYYLVSGATEQIPETGRQLRSEFLFTSKNLTDWTYLHPFIQGDRFDEPGDDGACPYFLPLGDKHVLLHFSHRRVPKYLLGCYDHEKQKFIPCSGGRFTSGYGIMTAPSAFPTPDGGAVVIFNMQEARYNKEWQELMTLPRKLTLGGRFNDELLISPVGDIDSLHGEHAGIRNLTLPAGKEIVLEQLKGNAIELRAELEVKACAGFEICVLRSPDAKEQTRIVFSRETGECGGKYVGGTNRSVVALDSTYSSVNPDVDLRLPETCHVYIPPEENVRLRLFVDHSIVEVYINDRQCMCQRVYPMREDSVGVSVRALRKDAALLSCDCWQMKSIYE